MDPATIGQKVKSIYKNGVAKDGRAYSAIPDAEIGSMYMLKNGDAGIKALGIDPVKQTAAEEGRRSDMQSALSSLDASQANLISGGGANPITGWTTRIPGINQFVNPKGTAYEKTKIETATALAKAITGSARPGQAVIEQYVKSLPSAHDNPEYASQLLANQRNQILTKAKAFGYQDLIDANPQDLATATAGGREHRGVTHEQNLQNASEVIKNIVPNAIELGKGAVQGAGQIINNAGQDHVHSANLSPEAAAANQQREQAALGGTAQAVGQSVANTFTNPEYNRQHPVEAALNVLPAIGASKVGTAGKTLEGATAAAEPAAAEVAAQAAPKTAGMLPSIGNGIGNMKLAARTFNSAFTIPTKRAKDLRPLDTSQKMVDYGLSGSMDQLKNTVQQVTGRDGVLTNLVNDAVANMDKGGFKTPGPQLGKGGITKTITDEIMPELDSSLELTPADKKMISSQLRGAENIKTPAETLAKVREFQNLGHQYLNKSTYLTGDIRKQNIGKAYLKAADLMNGNIEKAAGAQDIVSQLKTPDVIEKLSAISPQLAEDFKNATTLKEIRSLEAPFVRLNKMIDLTEQGSQSAASKVVKFGTGAGIGGLLGGIPGAALGVVASPAIEGVVEGMRTPALTKTANLMSRLPKIGRAAEDVKKKR